MSDKKSTRDRAHHPLSPSNWPAWLVCPNFQGGVSSAAAEAGTDQHEAYALALEAGVDDIDSSGPAWAARETLKVCGDAGVHVEDRVDITVDVDGAVVKTYGYADAWFSSDGYLEVIDFKSGCETLVDYWPQLKGYALGVAQRLGLEYDVPVKLHILYGAEYKHIAHVCTLNECEADAKLAIAKRIYRTDADRCQCPQCRWCANRESCHTAMEALDRVLTEPTTLALIPDALLLDRLSNIEGIVKGEKERIRNNAIANGGFVESGDVRYEMRETAGSRKSVDILGIMADCPKLGLDVNGVDMLKACDIGKSDFLNLVKEQAKDAGVKVKQVVDLYNSHVERNPPTYKLVRVTK